MQDHVDLEFSLSAQGRVSSCEFDSTGSYGGHIQSQKNTQKTS